MISNWKARLHARYLLYRYIQPLVAKRRSMPPGAIHDNIFLFSQPRSGSTWLAETLCSIPESAMIDEPLWRGSAFGYGRLPDPETARCKETKDLNFYFYQPIPQGEEWPEAEEFFRKLLNVELPYIGLFMETDISKLLKRTSFVFKFCWGNLLLPWLIDQFSIRPIVLIRHPCAVVASQLHFWNYNLDPRFNVPEFHFNDYFKQYESILRQVDTPEKHLAAMWALNIKLIENHPYRSSKWLTITYENLYEQYDNEISQIFSWIKRPIPDNIQERKRVPSKSTKAHSLKYINSETQIDSWRDVLSLKQTSDILEIVSAFEIKTYSMEPMPHLENLYG